MAKEVIEILPCVGPRWATGCWSWLVGPRCCKTLLRKTYGLPKWCRDKASI